MEEEENLGCLLNLCYHILDNFYELTLKTILTLWIMKLYKHNKAELTEVIITLIYLDAAFIDEQWFLCILMCLYFTVLYVLPSFISISMYYFFHSVSQRSSSFSNFFFFFLTYVFFCFLSERVKYNKFQARESTIVTIIITNWIWLRRNWRWFKTAPFKKMHNCRESSWANLL